MRIEANAAGHRPEIASAAYVHPTATMIGRVHVGPRVFIGPNAVIRADEAGPDGNVEPIIISDSSNIQDGVIIHALGGTGVVIGPRTSIAHAAVVHGPCKIGARCFVGFHSVVFRAEIGDGSVVLHHSLVESAELPSGLCVPSMTAVRCEQDVSLLRKVSEEEVTFAEKIIQANVRLVENALQQLSSTQSSSNGGVIRPLGWVRKCGSR